jgi:glutathione S-transferase
MPFWSSWRRAMMSRRGGCRAMPSPWRGCNSGSRWPPVNWPPSSARLAVLFGAKLDIERAQAISRQLFDVLDGHLAGRRYLVGDTPTIADVAIYSYRHMPPRGVSLDLYGHVRAWLRRIEVLPGSVAMRRSTPPESV